MEFVETVFEPKHESLKDLKMKIEKEGLSFHPYIAMNAIQKEVENRAIELVAKHFKGMSIEGLGMCNAEIREYAEAEEAKWQAYQVAINTHATTEQSSDDTQEEVKAEITPIKKKKK